MREDMLDTTNWVLPSVLSAQARRYGDSIFVETIDGETLTYAEAERQAAQVAGFLHGLGVGPGDRVVVMLANGLDFIRIWAGLARLGAVMVGINTELKGPILQSQLLRSKAKVALVGGACSRFLIETLPEVPAIGAVIAVGDLAGATPAGVSVIAFAGWRQAEPYDGPPPSARDIACIVYTSGTSGPSKGVLLPHAHCYLVGFGMVDNCFMDENDIYYVTLPLFHVNGLFMQVYATLIAGGKVILRERFSASAWLDDIIGHGVTLTGVVGAIISFIFAQPATGKDRAHRLRLIMPGPNLPEQEKIWRERFGVPEVVSAFGMTEANQYVWGRVGETRPGAAGRVYDRYFDVRIVDPETDAELPNGVTGEIVVRPKLPFCFMAGYDGMPEKTVEATRNLWFHTGDAAYFDVDGYLFFVDRLNDRIRRRGENISSFEVEDAMRRLAGVAEVAAYAVPSGLDGGEDELMLAVVAEPGSALVVEDVAGFAFSNLPRFAQPRFIEMVDALPKTTTHKVQKGILRDRGVTAGAFDTLAARTSREQGSGR